MSLIKVNAKSIFCTFYCRLLGLGYRTISSREPRPHAHPLVYYAVSQFHGSILKFQILIVIAYVLCTHMLPR